MNLICYCKKKYFFLKNVVNKKILSISIDYKLIFLQFIYQVLKMSNNIRRENFAKQLFMTKYLNKLQGSLKLETLNNLMKN